MLMEQMGSKMIFFKGSLFLRVTQHKGLHLKWVGDSTEKILQKRWMKQDAGKDWQRVWNVSWIQS